MHIVAKLTGNYPLYRVNFGGDSFNEIQLTYYSNLIGKVVKREFSSYAVIADESVLDLICRVVPHQFELPVVERAIGKVWLSSDKNRVIAAYRTLLSGPDRAITSTYFDLPAIDVAIEWIIKMAEADLEAGFEAAFGKLPVTIDTEGESQKKQGGVN